MQLHPDQVYKSKSDFSLTPFFPPPQRIWVWMLLVLTVLVVELPAAHHWCIFDEAQVRVVRATSTHTRPRALTGQKHQLSPGRLSRHSRLEVTRRSLLGSVVQSSSSLLQPIRIKTWTARESYKLPEAEKERLEKAVEEAPSVLAYAVHCQTDAQGRPVAGVVVLCRDRLTGAAYSHQTTVQVIVVMTFDYLLSRLLSMRCFMRLDSLKISSAPGKTAHLLIKDVTGRKVSSHWESRILQGSIMAASLGDPTTVRIDPVTLAALQDTGWYSVNLSQAQSLVWGDGEGDAFGSLSTCTDNSSSFFCSGSGVGCHFLHLHKGKCQTDQYLEGCRLYKPLENGVSCHLYNKEVIGSCFFSILCTFIIF
ncbi:hypothetical protein XENORESO_007663 [Xenotaenia resolanae]|uniref:Leishmanolysin-like peptidase n=1 Tax=Xenotaenia resolanae TaxID=208358 RepID=A0ABV0VVE7_9TELE